jgi:hypothetical protein
MSKARDLARAGTALTSVDATELGYLDGVTSNVQTQLNQKPEYVAGKNKIVNGDFSLNSRGLTSTGVTTTQFTFDKWYYVTTGGTCTHSLQVFTPGTAPVAGYESANYAQFVTSGQSGTSDRTLLAQFVDNVRTFAGQTATISFWAKASSGTPKVAVEVSQNFGSTGSPSATVSTPAGTVTLSTSWARYSVTVAVPSLLGKTIGTDANTSSLGINLWFSAGTDYATRASSIGIQSNTFTVWGVQAEAGSTATPFTTSGGNLNLEAVAAGSQSMDGVLVSNIGSSTFASGTTAWAGYQVAGKNLVINGGFDYWQRGTSLALSSTYTYLADRFKTTGRNGAGTQSQYTLTAAESAICANLKYAYKLDMTSAATNTNPAIAQYIEDSWYYYGKTITVSFYAKASKNVTLDTNADLIWANADNLSTTVSHSLTTTFQKFTYTFTLSPSGTYNSATDTALILLFKTPMNDTYTVYITGVQAEYGSVATPFSRAGGTIQGELAACQRYYQKSFPLGTTPADATNANGYVGSTNSYAQNYFTVAEVRFPVQMRVDPTITYYNPAVSNASKVRDAGGINYPCYTNIGPEPRGFSIGINATNFPGGGTLGFVHYTAEAEL